MEVGSIEEGGEGGRGVWLGLCVLKRAYQFCISSVLDIKISQKRIAK
jgi:hypothetical protein